MSPVAAILEDTVNFNVVSLPGSFAGAILVNKQAGLLGLLGLIVLIKPNELSAQ
jgi:hypothetical protein